MPGPCAARFPSPPPLTTRRGPTIEISRPNDVEARRAPAEWFTGIVAIKALGAQSAPGRAQAAMVSFTPGARTAWHTHPFGQILYIIHGRARVQTEGGKVVESGPARR